MPATNQRGGPKRVRVQGSNTFARERGGVGHAPSKRTHRRKFTVKKGNKAPRSAKKGDFGRHTSLFEGSAAASGPFMPMARGAGMMKPGKRPRTKEGARGAGSIGGGGNK